MPGCESIFVSINFVLGGNLAVQQQKQKFRYASLKVLEIPHLNCEMKKDAGKDKQTCHCSVLESRGIFSKTEKQENQHP